MYLNLWEGQPIAGYGVAWADGGTRPGAGDYIMTDGQTTNTSTNDDWWKYTQRYSMVFFYLNKKIN